MRTCVKMVTLAIMAVLLAALGLAGPASAKEHLVMKGPKAVKAFFYFRDADPAVALVHLQLIQKTYHDKDLAKISPQPKFVVSILGPAARLVSSQREGFTPEQGQILDQIAAQLDQMHKEGINLEICMAAVEYFKLPPDSLLPVLKKVSNGWISAIGHQAHGYALIPVP
ncbi:MAG: hypothetical protein KQJ78_07060 [Deltaproteobacteria bacterium]|nr:hypothetical protein [Deltaproteobacteria bacterium]